MGSYADYGLTPEQYHAGLDKLWAALGCTGVQDKDVFTLASERIMAAEWRFEGRLERWGAARVCARVFEELSDFIGELQATEGEGASDALQALNELRDRLVWTLPFDPPVWLEEKE